MTAIDEAATRQTHQAMPFSAVLGVEVIGSSTEEVRARVEWTEERCTSAGAMHGAVFMGLADVCGGLLAFLNLPEGSAGTTTIESKTNFLAAVRSGYLNAVATPLHRGSTTIVIVTDLFDDNERRVGRVTQTQAVLRPRT